MRTQERTVELQKHFKNIMESQKRAEHRMRNYEEKHKESLLTAIEELKQCARKYTAKKYDFAAVSR